MSTAYKTGITRALSIAAVITANAMGQWFYNSDDGHSYVWGSGNESWSLQWSDIAGVGGHAYQPDTYVVSGLSGRVISVASAWIGEAGGGDVSHETTFAHPANGFYAGSIDASGTASIVVSSAELIVEIGAAAPLYRATQAGPLFTESDVVGDDTPAYGSYAGGTIMPPDGCGYERIRYYWRTATDATITVTCTVGGATSTATHTYTAGHEIELPDIFTRSQFAEGADSLAGGPYAHASVAVAATYDGAAITCDAPTHTAASGSIATATSSYGVAYSGGDGSASSSVSAFRPVRGVSFDLLARAMDATYPGTLAFAVQTHQVWRTNPDGDAYWYPTCDIVSAPSGAASASYTCQEWDYSYALDGGSPVADPAGGKHERCAVWACLSRDGLSGAGEDTDDWRTQIRGPVYSAWNVAQAASYAIDGGFAATGSITRTFTNFPVNGYRYLTITTDRAAKPIRVTLTGLNGDQGVTRIWSGNTDSGGAFVCDLCMPQNVTDQTDPKDSAWVDLDDGVSYTGPYWGLDRLTSLKLDNLEAGLTYTVAANAVALTRSSHSLLQFLHALKQGTGDWIHIFHTETDTVTTDTYLRSFLIGDTDGRRSVDTWCIEKIVTTTEGAGTVISYARRAISDLLLSELVYSDHRYPGWSGSLACPTSDGGAGSDFATGYLTANRPAVWLTGAGLMYADGWSSAGITGINCNSSAGIPAQMLIDNIRDWPAGMGDAFGAGGAGVLALHAGKVLRGGAWGLVTDADSAPVSDIQVDLDQGGSIVGSGTTDGLGEYTTATPHGIGQQYHVVTPHGSALTVPCSPLRSRRWRRACFRYGAVKMHGESDGWGEAWGTLTVGAASLARACVDVDSPRGWLHVGVDKRIRTYHLATWALAFESVDAADVDKWCGLKTDHRSGVLWCLGQQGAASPYTWRLYASHDGGVSGEEVLSVTARTAVIERDSERGMLIVLWENEANVQQQRSLDGGATWSTAADAMLGGLAFMAQVCDATMDPRRGNLVLVIDQLGNKSVIESTDLGETFAVRLS